MLCPPACWFAHDITRQVANVCVHGHLVCNPEDISGALIVDSVALLMSMLVEHGSWKV